MQFSKKLVVLLCLVCMYPATLISSISVGGYVFPGPEAFADEASAYKGTLLPHGTLSVNTALTDINLNTWVISGETTVAADIKFTDNVIVNEAGPDFVVFEYGTAERYSLAVSHNGSAAGLTDFREYKGTQAIDLSDFGVSEGNSINFIRLYPNIGGPSGELSADIQDIGALHSAEPSSPLTDKFDFNDGTTQGWTLQGPFDETGAGPFISHFTNGWQDAVSYPNAPGLDPIGNDHGSIKVCNVSGHGITGSSGEWWIIQFHSPDLTSSTTWQNADGYSVELAQCMQLIGSLDEITIYSNLYVVVHDLDEDRDRFFFNGTAVPLTNAPYGDPSGTWNHLSFDWSVISGFPTNYVVKKVFVNIWGRMSDYFEGGVYLDEVTPFGGSVITRARLELEPLLIAHELMPDNSVIKKLTLRNTGNAMLTFQLFELAGQQSTVAGRKMSEPEPAFMHAGVPVMPTYDRNGDSMSEQVVGQKLIQADLTTSFSLAGNKDVMITGWGNLNPGPPLDDMRTHLQNLGFTVTMSNTFPSSLSGYEILILVGGGSANEDIPEATVDAFVHAGNGLILFEGCLFGGDFDASTAACSPVQSHSGWTIRTNAKVVDAANPLSNGISTTCLFKGYSITPVMKPAADIALAWNDDTPFAATFEYGSGRVVFFNDLWAWYAAGYWSGDSLNGTKLMENALNYVLGQGNDVPWLSLNPTSGSIPAGESEEVDVTLDATGLSEGVYQASIRVQSNDPDNPTRTVDVQLTVSGSVSLPSDWQFTANTGNSATIVLPVAANPNIDGTPLMHGDYIGVFTPSGLCCGWSQWQGANMSITAWGDDDQTAAVDGFQVGEKLSYRVYRASEDKEWDIVDVSYSQGNGLYSVNAFMIISSFDVTEQVCQTLDLLSGWNMISFNVTPDDMNVESIFAPVVSDLIIAKNGNGQTYIPVYSINDIGTIQFDDGYQVYMTQAASLEVCGRPVEPATPIDLPAGWSLISYLPQIPINITTALASINSKLIICKNNDGQTYIPAYGINDIGQMQPGQGYYVYMESAGQLIYPSSHLAKVTMALSDTTQHFKFISRTSENAVVVVPSSIAPSYADGTPLEAGDEIGVFTTAGMCCGGTVWDGTNKAITVWGDNSQTAEVDGFSVGDTLHFRIWQKTTDTEFFATSGFQDGHPPVYQVNGFSVLTSLVATSPVTTLEKADSAMPAEFALLQNYPNPFNPITEIRFQLSESTQLRLDVYNLSGQHIRSLLNVKRQPGYYSVRWDARDDNGVLVPSGVYIYRLLTLRHVVSKKMILLK